MKVITVITHSDRYFPVLEQSCKRHNIELIVLGFGQKWQGFAWRYSLVLEYLKNVKDDEIIIFIDAYDVIFLQDTNIIESKIVDMLSKTNSKMIIGYDKRKNYIMEFFAQMFFGKCNNLRINAGTYTGYCKDIVKLLTNLCSLYNCKNLQENDDQILITKYCKKYPTDIYIDNKYELFIVILPNSNLNITINNNELIYNFSTKPSILHGPAYLNMDEIIYKLGYNNINIFKENDQHKYKLNVLLHVLKHYILLILIIFSFILIIIIIKKYKLLKLLFNKIYKSR